MGASIGAAPLAGGAIGTQPLGGIAVGDKLAWTPTAQPPPTGVLDLPRVEWEGGPDYWAKFPKAAAWANPNFFPIAIFPCTFSSQSEIAWDKAHGINTYLGGLNEWTPWTLIGQNGMHYIGDPYTYQGQTMPADYAPHVGYDLGDEIDGRYSATAGLAELARLRDLYRAKNDGRFLWTNYTQMVNLNNWTPGEQYVNGPADTVSMDMYWYTIPNSSFGQPYVSDVRGPTNPRSATSYGAMVRGLRQQDAKDGKRQPIWMYVENLSGGPGEQFVRYITPDELKGAAWSSLIAEARGLTWFNSAMSGPSGQVYGNVLRQAQVNSSFVGKPQVEAMGQVNLQIQRLAPVLNTQSYVWNFGSGLETMLKAHNGYAYVFAMCANGSTPGSRTFTLPDGVRGTTVEVVDETRTLTVSGGKFTDTLPAEYTYRIYRITL